MEHIILKQVYEEMTHLFEETNKSNSLQTAKS